MHQISRLSILFLIVNRSGLSILLIVFVILDLWFQVAFDRSSRRRRIGVVMIHLHSISEASGSDLSDDQVRDFSGSILLDPN